MLKIRQYYEEINTECQDPFLIISQKAFKVDDSRRGVKHTLKKKLGAGNISSCDYIRWSHNKINYVEFSNIALQYNNLSKKANELQSLLDKNTIEHLCLKDFEKPLRQIVEENKIKIHGSLNLTLLMAKKFRKATFYLVFCDIENIDVKLLQAIKSQLENHFGTKILSIEVIPLKEFTKLSVINKFICN